MAWKTTAQGDLYFENKEGRVIGTVYEAYSGRFVWEAHVPDDHPSSMADLMTRGGWHGSATSAEECRNDVEAYLTRMNIDLV